jgi:hypothetical protein
MHTYRGNTKTLRQKILMRILYIYVANQQTQTDKICFIIYSGFIMMMIAEAIETCR